MMPCRACRHPQRSCVNRDLLAGASLRQVAARYGLTRSSLSRHQRRHALTVHPDDHPTGPPSARALARASDRLRKRGRHLVTTCPHCGADAGLYHLSRLVVCFACGHIAELADLIEPGRKAGSP